MNALEHNLKQYFWHVRCWYSFPVLHKVMRQSKNAIIKHCFPSSEPDSKRRPETVRNDSEPFMTPLVLNWNENYYKQTINTHLPASGGDSV